MTNSLLDIIPFLAIPVGVWEARKVQKTYGIPLGLYAGVISGGGIFLWLYLLCLIGGHPAVHQAGWMITADIVCFGLAPFVTALWVNRKIGLSAGVFAGVVIGCLLFLVRAMISISLYGT